MTEHDPTAIEPEDLPPKPPEPDLPSDTELEGQDPPGDLEVPEEEFLDASEASEDDTVDDEEHDDGSPSEQ